MLAGWQSAGIRRIRGAYREAFHMKEEIMQNSDEEMPMQRFAGKSGGTDRGDARAGARGVHEI